MEISIRQAVAGDSENIARLHSLVWPEQPADPDRIQRLIDEGDHTTHLAFDPLGLVGYTDGFATQDANGATRWELDLLAVHPRVRRRGAGKALAAAQAAAAVQLGAQRIRALVRLNNRAAHRTFASAGFQRDPLVYHLYMTSAGPGWAPDVPKRSHLVRVETFTYDGWWIEGSLDSGDLLFLLGSPPDPGDRRVGALIDPGQIAQADSEAMVTLTFQGAFQWYRFIVDRSP